MDKTLNSNAVPTRPSTSDLNIHGKVGVDLRKTVEILRNSGVNVTVCNKEPPTTHPTVVGKGKATQSKGKQSTIPNVLAKGNGKALTIDCPSNKRQKTMEKVKEKQKDGGDSNEVVNISRYAIGQQRRRERERLEGRIRPLPLIRGLVPTRKAIAQRRRFEIKRAGIDLQASSKQTNVDLLSLSTMGLETPDLSKQPNILHLPLCNMIPIKNAIAQGRRREIERNEIDLHAQSRQTEIESIEIDLLASSKQADVDLVSLSMKDSETLDMIVQPNIREIKPLTTHGEKNNLQGQSQSMLGRILSLRNIAGELTENETAQVHLATTPNVCLTQKENMELTKHETVQVHPATLPSVCLMQEENMELPKNEILQVHRATPPSICLMEENMELTKNETVQMYPATPPSVCLMREENMELVNVELTKNDTVQVHPATPPSVCLMQEENMELTKNEPVQVHPATPPSVCLMQEDNILISPPDLSTAISDHRQTYLQLFLILYLGRVTLGGSI